MLGLSVDEGWFHFVEQAYLELVAILLPLPFEW